MRQWIRAFRDRSEDRTDLTIEERSPEKIRLILLEADTMTKDEDYMRPDAQGAQTMLGGRGARALEDLSWIDVKVDVKSNKEE